MPTTAMAKWLTHKVFGQPFASQRQARRQDLAAGGQKPERGGKFLKYSIGCMQQLRGQT